MRRIIFALLFLTVLLSVLTNPIYANENSRSVVENRADWKVKSYAPDLDLLPYFEFSQQNTAACGLAVLPFWEGFNTDSNTLACWTVIDANKDSSNPSGNNIWHVYDDGQFEGDQSMYFLAYSKSNDWLISPTFKLDASKTYKLRYNYKTTSSKNEFAVLGSTKGVAIADFTTTIIAKKTYNNDVWLEAQAFITNISGDFNIAWQVTSTSYTNIFIDNISFEEVACVEPEHLSVKGLKASQATIYWQNSVNTAWEYFVEEESGLGPKSVGITTTNTEVVITQDHLNNTLLANTAYNYYIRAKCASGAFGEWVGPFVFKTLCSVGNLPLIEGFNTSSTTFDCWRIRDNNKDALDLAGDNIWKQSTNAVYEGDQGMYFYGDAAVNDDWLISPTFKMNGGIYAITYYYKTTTAYSNDFEVLLSKEGIDPVDFKLVIEPSKKRNVPDFVKKVLYVQGETGDVNIAWHVKAKGTTQVYIDLVTIEEVSCIGPDETVLISNLQKDKATFTWTDSNNSNWECFTQPLGASLTPVGSGSLATGNSFTTLRTNGPAAANLVPNTWYEFFVRSTCGPGKNSLWVGPIAFRTPCDILPTPFWEGFNTDSKSFDCWSFITNNIDITSPTDNSWIQVNIGQYEGDQSLSFRGRSSNVKYNEWLITPQFTLDPTKFYRLKYQYATSFNNSSDFEVLLSNKGSAPANFTTSLITKKGHSNSDWAEEKAFINGIGGTVNIAWHLTTSNSETEFNIDHVFLEEVVGCPEPILLGVKDEKETSATIRWDDAYGKNWEYVVQKSRGKIPTTNGVATNKQENVITKLQSGGALEPNLEYEFYVRTVCGNGEFSIWAGPFKFKTACGVNNAPFWEGFNNGSKTLRCWTIIDGNNDSEAPDNNIWSAVDYGQFEGSHAMYYSIYDNAKKVESDDWLISPKIKFEKNKTYRLKYHFSTNSADDDNEFEVLASRTGLKPADFSTEIVKSQLYKQHTVYQQKTVFITNLDGEIHLAWHVKGKGTKSLYLDNVFIEEVMGCPEPLNLEVTDIESKKATISWTDDFQAAKWEYFVQEIGMGLPTNVGTPTVKKENTLTQDHSGKNLLPNTDYEYYVRTVCADGTFSVWAGPIKFMTLCDIYALPFWEGFNKDSKTLRCWTTVDANNDGSWGNNLWAITSNHFYEGDRAMGITAYDWGGGLQNDDWLISPNMDMGSGNYVLKYHYMSSDTDFGKVEVLLSTNGLALDKFTNKILDSKAYSNSGWKEEVVFFKGIPGTINLAWHMNAAGSSKLIVDNIVLKKVENCPEPYYIETSNHTATSIDVAWQQNGGVSSWEVIVVYKGQDETATPIQKIAVNNTPKTTINGLTAGKAYTIFVRAQCSDGNTSSDWSTPVHSGTKVGANDDCVGATHIPVSKNGVCEQSVIGTFLNSKTSVVPEPTCGSTEIKKDIWFEFTATRDEHVITLSDYFSLSDQVFPEFSFSLYSQDCNTIGNTALECFSIYSFGDQYRTLKNLVAGRKYYIRVATAVEDPDFYFSLCITTPHFIEVSPAGDRYSVEQLVKEVLVVAECDLVSNVTYRTGTNFRGEPNGIGYFERNNSTFGFENGIVLATNGVETAKGPSGINQSDGTKLWLGDEDLETILLENGQTAGSYNASVIEFDFIPITDTIKFDFIFAANEYGPEYQCKFSDVFAFLLTDLETEEMTNLAVVPGTNVPISVTTIRDAKYQGNNSCGSTNEKYFDKYYGYEGLPVRDNPINYFGMTVPMTAISAVKPGKKYHIKLAIADYRDERFNSAVFLKGGSFDLGKIDLGIDLLVETGNALCNGETRIIKSGVTAENVAIQWLKDDVVIKGATSADLEVTESGTYKIIVKYLELKCEIAGTVKIEIYPAISAVVASPESLAICRKSVKPLILNLTDIESQMLSKAVPDNYTFTYFTTKEEAKLGTNPIENPEDYSLETPGKNVLIYIRVVDKRTGCSEIFDWTLKATAGDIPEKRADVAVCASYTFPELEVGQHYYSESASKGVEYFASGVLSEVGVHTIYVLQDNGSSCYEEISYKVTITEAVKAAVFEDVVLECQLYELEPLASDNKYYTLSGGKGVELEAGTLLTNTQTIYVYAVSDDGLCTDESSFTIRFEDCPIPKGISPNGDGLNDDFDLSLHGVTSMIIYNRYGSEVFRFEGAYTKQWYGQDKKGNRLPDGTYFYVLIAHEKTRSGWVQINK